MRFYVGLHQPSNARHFERCMVSVARLRDRKGDFPANRWMMDSGAFTEVSQHGRHLLTPEEYAAQIRRWRSCGLLEAAVSQDWMCEPFVLAKTGLTAAEHQRLTVDRFRQLRRMGHGVYILPVLQGYWPEEYVAHVRQYGDLLPMGAWVGVGSVCKRNSDVGQVEQVLRAIVAARPDLRLHGFGLKTTALESSIVRECLASADSMAWSYAARKQGRDGNSWIEAERFRAKVVQQRVKRRVFQPLMF